MSQSTRSTTKRNIFWFRRDLRLTDNPALLAAIAESDEVLALFIIDAKIESESGPKRLSYLAESLKSLDKSLDNKLHVFSGDEVEILKNLISKHNISEVHISQEYEPMGAARDIKIEAAGIKLVRTGSPYAVAPGRVLKPSDHTPYKVYTPFYRAWCAHGWREPVSAPKNIKLVTPVSSDRNFVNWQLPEGAKITEAGEVAALARWQEFKAKKLASYDTDRNNAGIDGTSKLSAHLAWGEIHPRTLLAQLGDSTAHDVFRKEIAWREFYADILFNNPHTDHDYYAPRFKNMRYDSPGKKFKAWCEGKTGYPFVDAAMRQLLTEGWMHNRTRMVVASFLVKDLHLEWTLGADFFMAHLVDFDIASNSHGWQWTAGCGTDASPYYRVFNQIEQGKRFDADGDYIRKYVPELAHLDAKSIHEPWEFLDGYSHGYPERIVNHAAERLEALARLEEIKVE